MSDDIQDVIQIGLGPVGLTMAGLVGQSGHTITAVERHPDLYKLSRAGHIDHEIVRILQSLDAEGPVLDDCYPTLYYVWVNKDGEKLLEFDWGAEGISGYHSDFMMFQPVLEASLAARTSADPNVTTLQGWEAVEFHERDDHVELLIRRTGGGEERTLRGRYLIGADGAGSLVRRSLGIERDDLGFNQRWLVVDARKKREIDFDFDCGQICDPARPTTILPLGKRHRRWEWSLFESETIEEFEQPAKAWELLAAEGIEPDDVEIVRQIVYTFEARTAVKWRSGRTFLMGDSAHTMPPFMGQGMCSGMRDAKNLAWKLDLVLRGLAPREILESYEEELRPYVVDWTVISLEAGKVPCITDPDEARERDELFRSGFLPPMPEFPQVREGMIQLDEDGKPVGSAGELALQANVRRDGKVTLFDDAFDAAGRWQVISTAGDPRAALTPEQLELFDELGAVFAHLGPGGDADDADGLYATYLAERDIEVVVVRPDFYVYGGAATLAGLPDLVDDLARRLALPIGRR